VEPEPGILAAFEHIAHPIDGRILLNERESLALTAARDALLPKLLSGEIRVPEAEEIIAKTTTNAQMEAAHG
jgi:type I restriction enzyme S subunit